VITCLKFLKRLHKKLRAAAGLATDLARVVGMSGLAFLPLPHPRLTV
jgi:hypothetical protein